MANTRLKVEKFCERDASEAGRLEAFAMEGTPTAGMRFQQSDGATTWLIARIISKEGGKNGRLPFYAMRVATMGKTPAPRTGDELTEIV